MYQPKYPPEFIKFSTDIFHDELENVTEESFNKEVRRYNEKHGPVKVKPENIRQPLGSGFEKKKAIATIAILAITAATWYSYERAVEVVDSQPAVITGSTLQNPNQCQYVVADGTHFKYLSSGNGVYNGQAILKDMSAVPGSQNCTQSALLKIAESLNPGEPLPDGGFTPGAYTLPNDIIK